MDRCVCMGIWVYGGWGLAGAPVISDVAMGASCMVVVAGVLSYGLADLGMSNHIIYKPLHCHRAPGGGGFYWLGYMVRLCTTDRRTYIYMYAQSTCIYKELLTK